MISLPLLATMMVITFFGIMIGTAGLLALYFRICNRRTVTVRHTTALARSSERSIERP